MTKAYSRKEDPKRGALKGAFAHGSDKAECCLVPVWCRVMRLRSGNLRLI